MSTAETELNSPGSGRPRTRTSRTHVRPMVDPSCLMPVSMLVPQLGGTFGALPPSVSTHARYTSTPGFTLFWCRHPPIIDNFDCPTPPRHPPLQRRSNGVLKSEIGPQYHVFNFDLVSVWCRFWYQGTLRVPRSGPRAHTAHIEFV